jgi:hypothetical protein
MHLRGAMVMTNRRINNDNRIFLHSISALFNPMIRITRAGYDGWR